MTYKVDNVNITISDELFEEAKDHMILDDGIDLLVAYSKNAIRANLCSSLEELKNYSSEKVFCSYSEKELSDLVSKELERDIKESISVRDL